MKNYMYKGEVNQNMKWITILNDYMGYINFLVVISETLIREMDNCLYGQ